jgi:hypothetical protein
MNDMDKKYDNELFEISMKAIAISPSLGKAEQIINDLTRSLNQYNYIGLNSFKFEKTKHIKKFAKQMITRDFYYDQ